MPKFYFIFFILLISQISFGQVDDDAIRQKVLKINTPNESFIFGKWNKKNGTESHLKYLGLIKTKKNNYKIMTSTWYWGLSKRATSRLLIYDANNNYLGHYYMGVVPDLPDKIENNNLIFINTNYKCDTTIITKLSFENGIPIEFFIECKDGFGDIFIFEKE